jgi:hypothetical protein
MLFSYGCGQTKNRRLEQIHVNRRLFQWPWGCGGAMRGASPNGAHPGLASLEATGCRHRASAPITLPLQLTILVENTKH